MSTAAVIGAPPAPVGRRVLAALIDGAGTALCALPIWLSALTSVLDAQRTGDAVALSVLPTVIGAVLLVAWGVTQWVLHGTRGWTVGRRLLGLRVVDALTGRPIGLVRALVRALIVALGVLACGLGQWVVYASVFWDPTGKRRGWHDRVAEAVVVDVRGTPAATRLDGWQDRPASAPATATDPQPDPAPTAPSTTGTPQEQTRWAGMVASGQPIQQPGLVLPPLPTSSAPPSTGQVPRTSAVPQPSTAQAGTAPGAGFSAPATGPGFAASPARPGAASPSGPGFVAPSGTASLAHRPEPAAGATPPTGADPLPASQPPGVTDTRALRLGDRLPTAGFSEPSASRRDPDALTVPADHAAFMHPADRAAGSGAPDVSGGAMHDTTQIPQVTAPIRPDGAGGVPPMDSFWSEPAAGPGAGTTQTARQEGSGPGAAGPGIATPGSTGPGVAAPGGPGIATPAGPGAAGPGGSESSGTAPDQPPTATWAARLPDGAVLDLEPGPVLIGRNPAPLVGLRAVAVQDPSMSVSKTHLVIGADVAGAWVMDRGSTNGTMVTLPDGQRIVCLPDQRVRVAPGSVVFFGDLSLTVGLSVPG